MVLQVAFGITLQLIRGRTSEARAPLNRALTLAEQKGDADFQSHVLHTLWINHMRVGEVRTALRLARRAETITVSMPDHEASTTADWMLGISLHFGGEHAEARRHLERVLRRPSSGVREREIRRSGFDHHITARYVLGHPLWPQGIPTRQRRPCRPPWRRRGACSTR
jgi:hypothetical protein